MNKSNMYYYNLLLIGLITFSSTITGQIINPTSPCAIEEIVEDDLRINPNAIEERAAIEEFTKNFVKQLQENRTGERSHDSTAQFIIPVVLHVFHNGEDGRIDMEQAQSGLDILNRDMQGLNADWEDVDPEFEDIKASLDIQFCLASIDPDGNPTTGVNYYDDSLKMLNEGDLFAHAWDNFKYLNFYIPKYTSGGPSLFTAYAFYPSLSRVSTNQDGVFYSSIRWGYGEHSELEDEQEWASVVTHEVGHWLNLAHTFSNGCGSFGDYVDDTPPTTGGTIETSGCNNNDFSCGVHTNGENYMDYNHDCKKMFTQGQVDRMDAALHLAARNQLWSLENLIETGCHVVDFTKLDELTENGTKIYPNPAKDIVHFQLMENPKNIVVYSIQGDILFSSVLNSSLIDVSIENFVDGMYFYHITYENTTASGKFIVKSD